jgi:hypothetical protein
LEVTVADLSDVEVALVAAVLALAQVTAEGCPILGGSMVRVFRGGPPVTALVVDRATGVVEISVFPVPNATRDRTRWGVQSTTLSIASGLSATVSGQTATFEGAALGGELAGVLVNDQPLVYQAQTGDTAALVAAALADQIRATQICGLDQSTLTIPGAVTLVARTTGLAAVLQEWARQEQEVRISVWAPTPKARDLVCSAIGAGLAQIAFLTLADGSAGRLVYRKTASFDDDQVASVYRRELVYDVEYGTTVTIQTPTMLFGDLVYNGTPIYV